MHAASSNKTAKSDRFGRTGVLALTSTILCFHALEVGDPEGWGIRGQKHQDRLSDHDCPAPTGQPAIFFPRPEERRNGGYPRIPHG